MIRSRCALSEGGNSKKFAKSAIVRSLPSSLSSTVPSVSDSPYFHHFFERAKHNFVGSFSSPSPVFFEIWKMMNFAWQCIGICYIFWKGIYGLPPPALPPALLFPPPAVKVECNGPRYWKWTSTFRAFKRYRAGVRSTIEFVHVTSPRVLLLCLVYAWVDLALWFETWV